MSKSRVIRRVLGAGVCLSLSLATCVSLDGADASTLSKETKLAGISVALADYSASRPASADADSAEVSEVKKAVSSEGDKVSTEKIKNNKSAVKKSSGKSKEESGDIEVGKNYYISASRFTSTGISTASDYVNIRKKPNTTSKVRGKLYEGSSAKILKVEGSWAKITSGDVNGYINKDYLAIGSKAARLAGKYGKKLIKVGDGVVTLNVRSKKSTKASIVTQIPEAEVYPVVKSYKKWVKIEVDDQRGFVSKDFVEAKIRFKHAVSIEEEKAKEKAKKEAEKAAAARASEREKTEAEAGEDSSASSKTAGSSSSTQKSSSSSSQKSSSSTQKSSTSASQKSSSSGSSSGSTGSSSSGSSAGTSSGNSSSSGSSDSTSSSSDVSKPSGSSTTGSDVANYAVKFVGNPYVYGGSSLTNGTDCSGFTMSVYASFGYSIPRTSASQSGYGQSVSFSELQPGDLIFYKNGSSVGHVALYIGGGSVVHASNPSTGIKISPYNYRTPYCARRIIH